MTVRLDGIDLVVFDKDGTLIEFGAMWSGWAVELADGLGGHGTAVAGPLFAMLGYDPATGRVAARRRAGGDPDGAPARADPRASWSASRAERGRRRTRRSRWPGTPPTRSRWRARWPTSRALFDRLRAAGRRIAVATSDDREPTERTLAALGVTGRASTPSSAPTTGSPVKPAPDMVLHLCAAARRRAARTAVVGDSPADLRMGRAAGAGLVIGVLTGVGDAADLEPLADSSSPSVERARRPA